MPLAGCWVGKFETSNNGGKIQIKGGTSSWRRISVNEIYNTCVGMNSSENSYGLSTDDSVIDPHMMKNTEWGAVAYLAESKYGRNGTEIAINNSSSYITGTSGGTANASSSATTYVYNDATNGVLSSTTGNVYGIYDMSGGAYEYVMGIYGTTAPTTGNSGFTAETIPESKYYNLYTAKNNSNIGDALYETSGWNNDYADFVDSYFPFFIRGGGYYSTSGAGVFVFSNTDGNSYSSYGFRVCLAV